MRLIINNKVMKKDYPTLGAIGMSKKYGMKSKYFINRAYSLKIKYLKKIKPDKHCEECNKIINKYTKSELCHKCSAKKNYLKRGAFSHNNSKLWEDWEVKFLIKNYYNLRKERIITNLNRNWSSILHKANRLGLRRNEFFIKEGNIKGRKTMINNNPMLNPEIRAKAKESLKRLYREHPEKLLNSRLRRNQMTNIEKKISEYLDSIGIKYDWNKVVRTRTTWRFPDFRIDNLIIEADGLYWHNKNKEGDKKRQLELEALGFKVIRFSDKEILKNFEEVKKCIQLELNQ